MCSISTCSCDDAAKTAVCISGVGHGCVWCFRRFTPFSLVVPIRGEEGWGSVGQFHLSCFYAFGPGLCVQTGFAFGFHGGLLLIFWWLVC